MKRAAALAVSVAFVAAGAALGFLAVRGPGTPGSIQGRVDQVAATLRCPSCHDLSVKDSPSIVARQMRASIASRLRRGESPNQIRAYFESRFGESVLLTPSGGGVGTLVWLVPVLLVAAGLGLFGAAITKWSRPGEGPAGPAISGADRDLLDRELRDLDPEGAT